MKRLFYLSGTLFFLSLLPAIAQGQITPTYLGEFTPYSNPTDVAVDAAGNVYVTPYAAVTKYSSTGEEIWHSGLLGPYVSNISVRGNSLVYVKMVGGGNATVRLSPNSGVPLETLNLGGNNVHVGDQVLYISKTSRVVRYNLAGEYELQWGATGTGPGFFSSGANDIAESSTGTILITDNSTEGGRLQ
jgi:hypothetical protein